MEDKQYLDEAGLSEVGKVIKEHYASKEDLSKIDVTEQLEDYAKKTDLNNKVDKVDSKQLSTNDYTNEDKELMEDWRKKLFIEQVKHHVGDSMSTYNYLSTDSGLLTGSYFMSGDRVCRDRTGIVINGELVNFDRNDPCHDLIAKLIPLSGIYCLETSKLSDRFEPVKSDAQECYIVQVIKNIAMGVAFSRITQKCKMEYSDNYIIEDMKANSLTIPNSLDNQEWSKWQLCGNIQLTLSVVSADSEEAGLMLPEDKKKLDSINVEAINSANSSNANTIKVCDVEKEILSKGADAPVGFYIDSAQQGDGITIYRLYIDSIFRSKCYYRQEFSPDIRTSQTQGVKATWANGQWIKNLIKVPQVD